MQVAFWVVFNVVWDGILGVGFLAVFSGAITVLTGWEWWGEAVVTFQVAGKAIVKVSSGVIYKGGELSAARLD
ncbi:MAG: hypothetical protein ABIK42_06065 [candidate division WOR-3 bacterium]